MPILKSAIPLLAFITFFSLLAIPCHAHSGRSRLVVNLLLPDRWSSPLAVLSLPLNLSIIIDGSALIRNWDDTWRLIDLLSRDSKTISRDPEEWSILLDSWWQVSLSLNFIIVKVVWVDQVVWNQATKSSVVGVNMWLQELGDEAWLAVWSRLKLALKDLLVSWWKWILALLHIWIWVPALLLDLERSWEAVEQWVQRAVHGEVEEDREDETDDGDDQRTDGGRQSKETDHANLGEVYASQDVLQGTWVDETLSVDLGVGDEEDVVTVGEVEEEDANGCEAEDEGCDHGVRDAWRKLITLTIHMYGTKHTNNDNIGIDWQDRAPRDGTERSPLVVHGTWSACQEPIDEVEDDEADNLGDDARCDRQTLKDEVRHVEVRSQWQLLGQEPCDGGRVLAQLLYDSCSSRTDGDDQEDLNDLEGEVGILGEELDAREGWLSRQLGENSHNDWNQRHENCKHDGWQETGDNTDDLAWNLLKPLQPRVLHELWNVGDETDCSNWDSPEDNESCNDAHNSVAADDLLPPRDLERLPDNLIWVHSDIAWRHVKSLVVREHLVGALSIRLLVKGNEDSANRSTSTGSVGGLGGSSIWDELGESFAAVVDSVNLATKETKWSQFHGWTFFVGDPTSSDRAWLSISSCGRLGVLAESLLSVLQSLLYQLDLSSLELERELVSFFNNVINIVTLADNVDVLNVLRSVHLSQLPLVQIW